MKTSVKSSGTNSAAIGRTTKTSSNTAKKSPQKSGTVAPAKKQAIHSNANPGLDVTSAHPDEEPEAELVILLDKFVVESHFLESIENQFIEIHPHLLEDVDFTPAEIVGETYWSRLTEEGQRLAILCLKHLATEPDVPLCDVTCECCGVTSFAIV
jgi:hypothetical protein